MTPYVQAWLTAFVLTCAFEVPLATFLLRKPIRVWRALPLAVGAQLLTHPTLWFIVPRFSPYEAWLVVVELGVTGIEGAIYGLALWLSGRSALRAAGIGLGISALANALSLGVGLVGYTLGWL